LGAFVRLQWRIRVSMDLSWSVSDSIFWISSSIKSSNCWVKLAVVGGGWRWEMGGLFFWGGLGLLLQKEMLDWYCWDLRLATVELFKPVFLSNSVLGSDCRSRQGIVFLLHWGKPNWGTIWRPIKGGQRGPPIIHQ
jgi:hypothetical protein